MKKLTVLATALLLSATAYASSDTYYNHTTLHGEGYSSQEQAYNAGFDLVESLQTMSDNQLKWNLAVNKDMAHDFSIDNTEVTIEEYAKNRGEVLYRANVDVAYHYTAARDND
ncbi:DUF3316 domain-containing protein [Vibrio hannami]|uniref:DUF3316 domain-containing protein n=1 Tax=Vibrio hannami TaxID=2717094 RepID=UPI00240F944D|nr:DUF3316 domain-containing protein [Vibrio hannami]MDG3086082.1 DUF3316 domain-containing protein [Vibrio hannami]